MTFVNILHFEVLDLQTVSEVLHHLLLYTGFVLLCENISLYVQRPYVRSRVSIPVTFCVFVIYLTLLYLVRVAKRNDSDISENI